MTAVSPSPVQFAGKPRHRLSKQALKDKTAPARKKLKTMADNCYTTPTGRLLAAGSALGAAETHLLTQFWWAFLAYGATRLGESAFNGLFRRDQKAERQQPDTFTFRALMRDFDDETPPTSPPAPEEKE